MAHTSLVRVIRQLTVGNENTVLVTIGNDNTALVMGMVIVVGRWLW